jgi:hypothetical protein
MARVARRPSFLGEQQQPARSRLDLPPTGPSSRRRSRPVKLNEINPHAWLADTLTKLVNRRPASRIDELMPWNYANIGDQTVNV